MDFFSLLPSILVLLAGYWFLRSGWFIVRQQEAVILQRLGKFERVAFAGFHLKLPVIDAVAGKLTLKVRQLDVKVETKTRDNVFVHMNVSVQYQVLKDKVYSAFYELEDPTSQITSYIFEIVRAEVPRLKLDEVFEHKDQIAVAVKRELDEAMKSYGYFIVKALVTDIDPAAEVKASMNHINAAERAKVAAQYEAEAERIRIVAKAQADADSKQLHGQGIANQRREIAKGLEESVSFLNRAGVSPQEASALIMIAQHYDTLQNIGEKGRSNLLVLPSSPGTSGELMNQLLTALMSAQHSAAASAPPATHA